MILSYWMKKYADAATTTVRSPSYRYIRPRTKCCLLPRTYQNENPSPSLFQKVSIVIPIFCL